MLITELAIEIRRVKGAKRPGTSVGKWLSTDEAQDLMNSIPRGTILGRRDAALVGLGSDAVSADRKPCRSEWIRFN
jgi:hypothetical protein